MTDRQETILVVDDQKDVRATVIRTLAAPNRHFVEAETGQEALTALADHGFDAVVLDIMMPEMDGLDALAHIRAQSRLATLPVIMLTALEDKEVEALALGATDYVRKPFSPAALRLRLEAALTSAVAENLLAAVQADDAGEAARETTA